MQKALEATDAARQVASAGCSQGNGSAVQHPTLGVEGTGTGDAGGGPQVGYLWAPLHLEAAMTT